MVKERQPAHTHSIAAIGERFYLVLSFLLPFVLFGIFFAFQGIVPFGDRQIIDGDLSEQYFPVLMEIKNKLSNQDSLFYTWHLGLGTNFLALIGYYAASPLNLLLMLFPASWLEYLIFPYILLKISLSSLFFAIFLKSVFHNNINLSSGNIKKLGLYLIFPLCYAFCNYFLGFYTNIIWLDTVALLPLLALGEYRLLTSKRKALYIFALFWSVLSNFYIGYIVCLFVFFSFFLICFCHRMTRREVLKAFLKIGLCTLLALSLTAFLLLPAIFGMLSSSPYGAWTDYGFYGLQNTASLFKGFLPFQKPLSLSGDTPNLYCGLFCFYLCCLYFANSRLPRRERMAVFLFLAFLLASMHWNTLHLFWHAFSLPNMLPFRFSFLVCFIVPVLALRSFVTLEEYPYPAKRFVQITFLYIILLAIMLFMLPRIAANAGPAASVAASVSYTDISSYTVSHPFGIMLAGLLSVLTISGFLYGKAHLRKLCLHCFVFISIGELLLNAWLSIHTAVYPKAQAYNVYSTQLHDILTSFTDTGSFSRISAANSKYRNEPLMEGYNGINSFSTIDNSHISNIAPKLGIAYRKRIIQYFHGSPLTNMMLNMRYIYASQKEVIHDSTLNPIYTGDSLSLYANKFYLPAGFVVDDGFRGYEEQHDLDFDAQNYLFSALTGIEANLYTSLSVTACTSQNLSVENTSEGYYTYLPTSVPGQLTLQVTVPFDGFGQRMVYTIVRSKNLANVLLLTADGTIRPVDQSYNTGYIIPVGNLAEGESYTLQLVYTPPAGEAASFDALEPTDYYLYVNNAFLNEDTFIAGYQKLRSTPLTLTETSSNCLTGSITLEQPGLLYTSIPYDEGWQVFIDNKKTDITPLFLDAFIGLSLSAGEHSIQFIYTPKGLYAGIAISGLGMVLVTALVLRALFLKKLT